MKLKAGNLSWRLVKSFSAIESASKKIWSLYFEDIEVRRRFKGGWHLFPLPSPSTSSFFRILVSLKKGSIKKEAGE